MGGLADGAEAEVRVKLPVVIDRAAAAELRDHLARVANDSPATARALNEEVGTTLDLIAQFPQLYERFDGDLRRAVLKRWSLGIFYERLADAIFVAAILDLRRDPAAIRRRLGLHESATEFLANPGWAPSNPRPSPLF
jgi:plasmid stabilization system protein ParE